MSAITTANSTEPRYLDLTMDAAAGLLQIVSERHLPGGVLERTFAPTSAATKQSRRNPEEGELRRITLGPQYYQAVLNEYSEWKLKWWRECLQNSVDARAKHIACSATQQDDGTYLCVCDDDGTGMDEETLLDRFLQLGGTTKVASAGTTGGFGVAKALLILPWLSWSVETRDLRCAGVADAYRLTRGLPYRKGVRLAVVMPEDRHTTENALREFLERSSLSGVTVTVSGVPFKSYFRKGKLIRELKGKAEAYYTRSKESGDLYVRVNGLYMHTLWLPSEFKGHVIVELTGPSTELLASNRDSIRDNELARAVSAFVNEIASDTQSAVRSSKAFDKFYEGERFRAEIDTAAALSAVGPVPALEEGEAVELDRATLERLGTVLGRIGGEVDTSLTGPATAGFAQTVLDGFQFVGARQVEAAMAQLVWKPAFYLRNEREDYTVPPRFMPEKMSPQIRALAQLWAELCRWVLIQIGNSVQYGVGFCFSEQARAMYAEKQGQHWLLLNPFKDLYTRREVWSKTSQADLQQLYAMAIHECSHLDGFPNHNEPFAAEMTKNMGLCSAGFKRVKQIAAGIRERAPRTQHDLIKVGIAEAGTEQWRLTLGKAAAQAIGPGRYFARGPIRLLAPRASLVSLLQVAVTDEGKSAYDHYSNYADLPRAVWADGNSLSNWMARHFDTGQVTYEEA